MKDKKIFLIIIGSIFGILIIGISIYLIINRNKSIDDSKNNSSLETEITNKDVIKKLNVELNILNYIRADQDNQYFYPQNYFGIYSQNKITSEEIDKSDKFISGAKLEALIIWSYYNKKFGKLTTEHNFGNGLTSKDVKDEFTEISEAKIESEFKKTFDTNIKHKSFRNCPIFIYDRKTKMYYGSAQCGGGNPNFYLDIFNEKYTEDSNNAYIYIRVGSYDNALGYVYSDYERKNKIIEDANLIEKENVKVITSDNYNKFSQYKITFNKNKNSYIFKQIELIGKI